MIITDYIAAGYYLARFADRPAYISAELMPKRILSASPDICYLFPDTWALEWTTDDDEGRIAGAANFGISTAVLPKVIKWATQSFSTAFGWPNVFYSLESAQKARHAFLADRDDVALFGLGLHKSNVKEFLDFAAPPLQQPGFAPMGKTGVFEAVSQNRALVDNGISLGYELLVTTAGLLTCSWLCNGLEVTFAKELGIKPNSNGFIQTFEEASRCANFISEGHVGAEPGLWLPWLTIKYG